MATKQPKRPLPMAADLYGDLYGDIETAPKHDWRGYVPGLVVVAMGTLAAGFLSDHYGVPLTLMALLIGLALNFLSADARLTPGLAFASRSLLRWGIVLVGVRITFGQIVALGPVALLCVVLIVALTMGAGILAARRFGFDTAFGILAGGSVAICGASAAMALATTLGEKRTTQAQLTLVLVGISAMSASAMMLYPLVAHAFHMSDLKAGFLLGAAIHDVAQALGAGYSYSDGAGGIAAIVKLTRVALLAPVLAVVAMGLARWGGGGEGAAKGPGVPWFVIGFFVLAGINSFGVIPPIVAGGAEKAAAAMLATAVTATAIRSPLAQLLEAGPKPLLVILIATLVAFGLALAAALLLIG
ncbi:phosphoenolpyruvate carboxylase [Sphingomonas glacialis]|uniref:Phosphoenolpyruvate carboxylase n=2 Tax=Sphingomonas glacialis TaxID=658225 RepID=A0ABQ3LJ51_9SPHN|nr:phosphoenolpyruvate carboxylase [Sphingomonas glacialis]